MMCVAARAPVVVHMNLATRSQRLKPSLIHSAAAATSRGKSAATRRSRRDCVEEITETYRGRRNVLCDALNRMGWKVTPPKATMMVWAEIPESFKKMGSLEFSKMLLEKAKVAVAPGIGFGEGGDHFVRFSLVENEHRIRQAVRGIREIL